MHNKNVIEILLNSDGKTTTLLRKCLRMIWILETSLRLMMSELNYLENNLVQQQIKEESKRKKGSVRVSGLPLKPHLKQTLKSMR